MDNSRFNRAWRGMIAVLDFEKRLKKISLEFSLEKILEYTVSLGPRPRKFVR